MVPCSICTLDDENAAVSRLQRESASTANDTRGTVILRAMLAAGAYASS